MNKNDWRIFEGDRQEPHNAIREKDKKKRKLPDPPRWRHFSTFTPELIQKDEEYWQKLDELAQKKERDMERGRKFFIRSNYAKATEAHETLEATSDRQNQLNLDDEHLQDYARVLDAVNAALYLRRPLLVTGRPGSGKTSLAYAIAYQLQLSPVLLWSITARTTLQDGLYQYDAIARLQDAQLQGNEPKSDGNQFYSKSGYGSGSHYTSLQNRLQDSQLQPNKKLSYRDIGQYIRLGPVGTAFLASQYPRVLLIDEIDKSDINLPNDLLNLFEEGEFPIPELVRLSRQGDKSQTVESADGLDITIKEGKVQCCAFPLVIMTSNGERDFPPAFLRRCLRIRMPDPDENDLKEIVKSHLDDENIYQSCQQLIEKSIQDFIEEQDCQEGNLATDQLLNNVYLITNEVKDDLKEILFRPLTSVEDEK